MRLQEHLLSHGVEMKFMTMVERVLVEGGRAIGVATSQGEEYYGDEIVCAVGREGADWFSHVCKEQGVETKVDCG